MENIIVTTNRVKFADKEYRCAIGPNGISADKKEGDGKTPAGIFPIRVVYYRADKIVGIRTALPITSLQQDDGWADDQNLPEYNTLIKLPYNGSHEKLWRDDDLYDIIVVIGYNDDPPVPGKGSAIFMHIARPEFTPTAGCVALSREDLLELLSLINPEAKIEIKVNS